MYRVWVLMQRQVPQQAHPCVAVHMTGVGTKVSPPLSYGTTGICLFYAIFSPGMVLSICPLAEGTTVLPTFHSAIPQSPPCQDWAQLLSFSLPLIEILHLATNSWFDSEVPSSPLPASPAMVAAHSAHSWPIS